MSTLKEVNPEYVYITIPAEYICVYHRILAMLADYGEEMLEDCKATCTDKNSGVIECFNMFNAAVAARKLGKTSLANTIIKYVKSKINQIYQNKDNSTSFVFPIDEDGQLKAFVSCGERPKFEINLEDGELYEHKFGNGFPEHFKLGDEDYSQTTTPVEENDAGLVVDFNPYYEAKDGTIHPCVEISISYNGIPVNPNSINLSYYFDDKEVVNWNDIQILSTGEHEFQAVVIYNNETKIVTKKLRYGSTS